MTNHDPRGSQRSIQEIINDPNFLYKAGEYLTERIPHRSHHMTKDDYKAFEENERKRISMIAYAPDRLEALKCKFEFERCRGNLNTKKLMKTHRRSKQSK